MKKMLLLIGLSLLALSLAAPAPLPSGAPRTVLLELFTSQGCSSCPAADDLLRGLVESQPVKGVEIIVLSQHVDYWNRLGWRDPYSQPLFTQRQRDYARSLRRPRIYTPQVVIDGAAEVVGSNRSQLLRAVHAAARQPQARLQVGIEAHPAHIRVHGQITEWPEGFEDRKQKIFVAISQTVAENEVPRGENAGRRLLHSNTVLTLVPVKGHLKDDRFSVDIPRSSDWPDHGLRAVAFLQTGSAGPTVASASIAIPKLGPADASGASN